MAENIRYSHADIMRYLQQQMPPGEMHAFEKALMDDPFLSDALEGYTKSDPAMAASHLFSIKNNINEREENTGATIMPLFGKKTGWWRVAAIFLVVSSAGIFTYSLLKQPAKNTYSDNIVIYKKEANPPLKNDSVGPVETQPALVSALPETEQFKNKTNSAPTVLLKKKGEHNASATVADGKVQMAHQEDVAVYSTPLQTYNDAAISTEKEVEKKDINAAHTDVPAAPSASIATAKADKAIYKRADVLEADRSKLYEAVPRDTTMNTGKYDYAKNERQTVSNEPAARLSIQQDNHSMATVPMNEKPVNIRGMASSSGSVVSSTPAPAGGWNMYDQYVKTQADSILLADGKVHENIPVEVIFNINKNGKPANLKVAGKAPKYYIKKATYIVAHGPLWRNAISSTAKVVIVF